MTFIDKKYRHIFVLQNNIGLFLSKINLIRRNCTSKNNSLSSGKTKNMTILNFIDQFPDEKSCRDHMRGAREKEGVVCKNCKGTKHYWLKAKCAWQSPGATSGPPCAAGRSCRAPTCRCANGTWQWPS